MSGLKIEHLLVQNFKCHKNLDTSLKNLNILTGNNAAGKSSMIQAILLAYKAFDEYDRRKVNTSNVFGLKLGTPSNMISEDFQDKNIRFEFQIREKKNQIILQLPDDDFELSFIVQNIEDILEYRAENGSLGNINFFFLNAEREGPRLISAIQDTKPYSVGNNGENTNYIIGEMDILQKLNEDFQLPKQLKKSKLDRFSANCEEWLKDIIPGTEFECNLDMEKNLAAIHFKNEGEFYLPTATGFGITYVLPIIVQALVASVIGDSILIVENPEAHLHPYSQSKIGKFLAAIAANGVQVFVETHSEHVIDGCRIQAAKDKNCNNMEILFFEKDGNESICKNIDIADNGELDYWPEGFFDQKRLDLRELLEMRK